MRIPLRTRVETYEGRRGTIFGVLEVNKNGSVDYFIKFDDNGSIEMYNSKYLIVKKRKRRKND